MLQTTCAKPACQRWQTTPQSWAGVSRSATTIRKDTCDHVPITVCTLPCYAHAQLCTHTYCNINTTLITMSLLSNKIYAILLSEPVIYYTELALWLLLCNIIRIHRQTHPLNQDPNSSTPSSIFLYSYPPLPSNWRTNYTRDNRRCYKQPCASGWQWCCVRRSVHCPAAANH